MGKEEGRQERLQQASAHHKALEQGVCSLEKRQDALLRLAEDVAAGTIDPSLVEARVEQILSADDEAAQFTVGKTPHIPGRSAPVSRRSAATKDTNLPVAQSQRERAGSSIQMSTQHKKQRLEHVVQQILGATDAMLVQWLLEPTEDQSVAEMTMQTDCMASLHRSLSEQRVSEISDVVMLEFLNEYVDHCRDSIEAIQQGGHQRLHCLLDLLRGSISQCVVYSSKDIQSLRDLWEQCKKLLVSSTSSEGKLSRSKERKIMDTMIVVHQRLRAVMFEAHDHGAPSLWDRGLGWRDKT